MIETEVASRLLLFDPIPKPGDATSPITLADGTPATQAGSHPYELRTAVGFPIQAGEIPYAVGGGVKDLEIGLPAGLIANPLSTPTRCAEHQLEESESGCPDSSQVGILSINDSAGALPGTSPTPLYNMIPPGGTAVEFGAEVFEGVIVHVLGRLRSDGDVGFSAGAFDLPAQLPVAGAQVVLWGDPSDSSHDYMRGRCLSGSSPCPVPRSGAPFLTLPTSCLGPLRFETEAASWIEPGSRAGIETSIPALDGCNRLDFEPTLTARPTADLTGAPTGIDLGIQLPQSDGSEGLAKAALKDATITLPEGIAISPAGATGLAACTGPEIGLRSGRGELPVRFSSAPPACPDAAKIGTVEARTPLIDHVLQGGVYVAEQGNNPFGSRFAIYLTLNDPPSGVVVKLAGRVEADVSDGRLTASFVGLPQLPIEDLRTHFFEGPRAVLRNPTLCGTHSTSADLVPWSSPEGSAVTRSDSFDLRRAPSESCPRSESELPAAVDLSAGSVAPAAGRYSPFLLRVSRPDGSRRLTGIDVRLPAGVSASLAGVKRCEAAAATAGICPATSRVGRVDLLAGPGPLPLSLGGTAYLAGPY
jgi:hypothetical protein